MNEKTDEHRIMSEVNQIFQEADPDIEVKVRMININHGHNQTILSACRPLAEYALFVAQTRNNLSSGSAQTNPMQVGIGDAIDKAINEMPEAFEIKKYIYLEKYDKAVMAALISSAEVVSENQLNVIWKHQDIYEKIFSIL